MTTIDDFLAHVPADNELVVLVVRDPDASNEITVFGNDDAIVIDVDLGRLDLTDRDEFLQWAESQYEAIERLPQRHPARSCVLTIVWNVGDEHGFADNDAIKAAIAERSYPAT
jgi:hypothetical protein